MQSSSRALLLSRKVLRLLVMATAVYTVALLGLLTATLVAREWSIAALGIPPAQQRDSLVLGMRLIMVGGLAGAAIFYVIIQRLREVVDTVFAGDPFIVDNAGRLRTIAWALLAAELLHYVIGGIAASISTESQPLDVGLGLSLTRWIAVLLLFVLAGVFEHGARMRDDLEGTV
jgi:hypothetical protein